MYTADEKRYDTYNCARDLLFVNVCESEKV